MKILEYFRKDEAGRYKTVDFVLFMSSFGFNLEDPIENFLQTQLIRNLEQRQMRDDFTSGELLAILNQLEYLPPNPYNEKGSQPIYSTHLPIEQDLHLEIKERSNVINEILRLNSKDVHGDVQHSSDYYRNQITNIVRSMRDEEEPSLKYKTEIWLSLYILK